MKRTLPALVVSLATLVGVVAVAACSSDDTAPPPGSTTTTNDSGGPTTNTGDSSSPSNPSDSSTADTSTTPVTGAFSFTGKADPASPAGSKTVVIWSVSSGSPDYAYEFGGGTATAADVFVTFTADPPAEALNGGKIGIGFVGLVDAATTLVEGKLTKEQLKSVTYISPDHAIIFRNSTETLLKNGWDANFPQGYSCGACEERDVGFDIYVKTDCTNVKLVPYTDATKVCNWT